MRAELSLPRIVITGVGVVSPAGIGKEAFWDNLLTGRSGIGYLRSFPNLDLPSKLAAEVVDFDPAKYLRQKKLLKVMSRDVQLGVCSANMAMEDARLATGSVEPERLGVEFGAGRISITPTEFVEAAAACVEAGETFQFERFNEETMS